MLKINDLASAKELDRNAMANVRGGHALLSLLFDGSTDITNKVADVHQAFGLDLKQQNAGAVTNNQAISNGNGIVYAPVTQTLTQSNWLDVLGLGNTRIR